MTARKVEHMFDKKRIETNAGEAGATITGATIAGVTITGVTIAGGGAMPVDLARLGLSEIAYIRRALVNGEPMWTIFSAAGDALGAAPSFDLAWVAVRQNDLEPVRVH